MCSTYLQVFMVAAFCDLDHSTVSDLCQFLYLVRAPIMHIDQSPARAGRENLRLKMGRARPHPQRARPPWNGPPYIYARTVLELAELIRRNNT